MSFWLVPTFQCGNAVVAAPAANDSWQYIVQTCSHAGAWEPACLFRGDTSAPAPPSPSACWGVLVGIQRTASIR